MVPSRSRDQSRRTKVLAYGFIDSRGDRGDRRGAMAAVEAESERWWPVFKKA